jgi:hypothetical protein
MENWAWRVSRFEMRFVLEILGGPSFIQARSKKVGPEFIRTSTSRCGLVSLWLKNSDDIETQVFDNRIGEAYFTGLQFLYTISARGHQALISPRQ